MTDTATTVTDAAVRLDIGCGKTPRPGFIGVDQLLGGDAETLTIDGKGFADNSVDEVYASHVLEHLGHWQARRALRNWTRVLKPGGRIRVAVPDMRKVFGAYYEGQPVNVGGYTWGGQVDAFDFHKTGFDEGLLTALLEHFGITDVKKWEADQPDCARLQVSLNLEGVKAHRQDLDRLPLTPIQGVRMIQSMPRLAFTENVYAIIEAAVSLDLSPTRVTGVNWGQCLERAIEDALTDESVKWILTTDYDSIFTYKHIITLWNILHEDNERGHIHALAPVEFKREENVMLAGVVDGEGKRKSQVTLADIEPQVVPVDWAHFGLTFIHVDAIRRMGKPWFKETPAANGGWGPGRVDNDIGFWNNFTAAGCRCYVAPHVAIGHAQLLAVWPDQEMRPIYQFMNDWNKNRMPAEARR